MRKISSLFVLLLLSIAACSSTNGKSQLSGKIEKHSNVWLYLEHIQGANIVAIDSVKTNEKGEFAIKKAVPEKDFYRLRVSANNFVFVVLDPKESLEYVNSNVMLKENYSLKGSEEGKLILEIKAIREGINKHRDSLMQVINSAPEAERMGLQGSMEAGFNAFVNQQMDKTRGIIHNNPDKLAPITAAELLDPDHDFPAYEELANNLKKSYPSSGFAQSFIDRVEQMRKTAIGAIAPEINLPSPDGANIALSSLRGKVVLVDFWASWCGPCRRENPNVVRMYNEYKDKGFEVYSVSLDKEKTGWVNAIKQDGLVWPSHVSDLAYWGSSVVKQYGFQGIPFTVLLDKEGHIVAKGLRGPELEQAIQSLLK
jgi:thiol-disulfide isomerase/thioredoxin